MSVLLDLARVLDVEVHRLTGSPEWRATGASPSADEIGEIRRALTSHSILTGEAAGSQSAVAVSVTADAAHRRHQAAEYGEVTAALPALVEQADALVAAGADAWTQAYVGAYVVVAKHLTKLGVADLASLAADRAATAASRTASPVLQGSAAYQVVAAWLLGDQLEQAERLAVRAGERITAHARPDDPRVTSVAGSLWLIAAVIAARRADRWEAHHRLEWAQTLADLLGFDANHAWTAFGPTNVAIHKVSVAAELGDPTAALAAAADIDLDRLPGGLSSRRAQVRLDLAWAHAQRRRDADATLHLLDAEAAAPEVVARNPLAREIIRAMVSRARHGQSTALSVLATRAGVLP